MMAFAGKLVLRTAAIVAVGYFVYPHLLGMFSQSVPIAGNLQGLQSLVDASSRTANSPNGADADAKKGQAASGALSSLGENPMLPKELLDALTKNANPSATNTSSNDRGRGDIRPAPSPKRRVVRVDNPNDPLNGLLLDVTCIVGDKRSAMINGHLYKVNDTVASPAALGAPFKITEISLKKVVLTRDGKDFDLSYANNTYEVSDASDNVSGGGEGLSLGSALSKVLPLQNSGAVSGGKILAVVQMVPWKGFAVLAGLVVVLVLVRWRFRAAVGGGGTCYCSAADQEQASLILHNLLMRKEAARQEQERTQAPQANLGSSINSSPQVLRISAAAAESDATVCQIEDHLSAICGDRVLAGGLGTVEIADIACDTADLAGKKGGETTIQTESSSSACVSPSHPCVAVSTDSDGNSEHGS